jgi:hypothetical protein
MVDKLDLDMDTLELMFEFSRLTLEQRRAILDCLRAAKSDYLVFYTAELAPESYSSVLRED